MTIYEDCVEAAGFNKKQIKSIARRFQLLADECRSLNIQIFGGSTEGTLRFTDKQGLCEQQLILASIPGNFSGGDGSCREDENGLMRGE